MPYVRIFQYKYYNWDKQITQLPETKRYVTDVVVSTSPVQDGSHKGGTVFSSAIRRQYWSNCHWDFITLWEQHQAEEGKFVTLTETDSPPLSVSHTPIQSHSTASLSVSLFTVYTLKLCLGCFTSSESDFVCLQYFLFTANRSADILFVRSVIVNTPEEKTLSVATQWSHQWSKLT